MKIILAVFLLDIIIVYNGFACYAVNNSQFTSVLIIITYQWQLIFLLTNSYKQTDKLFPKEK